MPFDTLSAPSAPTTTPAEIEHAARVAEYMARRERACAAVLAKAPPERFDFSNWACGTSGCFIGWLAFLGIDGWVIRRRNDGQVYPRNMNFSFGDFVDDIEWSFGLTTHQALSVFVTGDAYDKPSEDITASDVAAALMAMPVTVWP